MFRDAGGRIPRHIQNDPWVQGLSLLGTILGQNAKQRNEAGVANVLAGVDKWQPEGEQAAASPGLLSGFNQMSVVPQQQPTPTLSNMTGVDISKPMSQQAQMSLPSIEKPQPSAQPAPQPQPQTIQAPDRNAIRASFGKDYALGMQELVGKRGYSAMDAKKLLDGELNTRIDDIYGKQMKAYNDSMIDQFESEQDPRKKIVVGMKSGLIGKEGAMMLAQPGTETKVINTGGENVVVGFNKLSGKYVNLKDGSEIAPDTLQEMLKPTLTPGQVQQGELTIRGQDISAANAAARIGAAGGRSSNAETNRQLTNAKYAIDKHQQWMASHTNKITGEAPSESQSPYYNYAKQGQQIMDGYFGIDSAPQQSGVDPRIAAARAAGYTDEEIQAFINGGGTPKPQPEVNPYGTGLNRSIAQIVGNAPVNEEDLRMAINELDNNF
jgi:hypothetical protein